MRAAAAPGSGRRPRRSARTGRTRRAVRAGPGQRPLVLQDQRLVRAVQLDPEQLSSRTPQARMKSIARSISRASCSYRAPAGEVRTNSLFQSCTRVQVGLAAGREGAQQVQRRRRGLVCPQQPARVGPPGLRRSRQVVDHVPPVRREAERVESAPSGASRTARRSGPPSPPARSPRRSARRPSAAASSASPAAPARSRRRTSRRSRRPAAGTPRRGPPRPAGR